MAISRADTDKAVRGLFKNSSVTIQTRWQNREDYACELAWQIAERIAPEFAPGELANGKVMQESDRDEFAKARRVKKVAEKAAMALHDLLEALQGDADPRARLAINRSIAYFLCYETEAAEEALLETFYPEAARVEVLLRQATTAAERISLLANFRKDDLREDQQNAGNIGDQQIVNRWLMFFIDLTGSYLGR